MKDYYSKNDFWVRKNEDSDERKYYIRLNGMYIEVSKDVFDTCYYSYRKELRDKKRDQDLLSLNTLNANNHSMEYIIGVYDDTIQSINDNILITKIKSIINSFNETDKNIAYLSLFVGESDEKISKKMHMKRSTVNYHKHRIYKILREQLTNLEEWL